MKIAVGSDMKAQLTEAVISKLNEMGHEIELFGALKDPKGLWPKVGMEVAEKVVSGAFDQAVLFCWTGTGICMAANKVKGSRAALCQDAETARGARKWNDANILVMSLRATSEYIAEEILEAWFATPPSEDNEDLQCIAMLP